MTIFVDNRYAVRFFGRDDDPCDMVDSLESFQAAECYIANQLTLCKPFNVARIYELVGEAVVEREPRLVVEGVAQRSRASD